MFANKGFEALCGLTERELKTLSPEALAARFEERFQEPALLLSRKTGTSLWKVMT